MKKSQHWFKNNCLNRKASFNYFEDAWYCLKDQNQIYKRWKSKHAVEKWRNSSNKFILLNTNSKFI